MKFILSWWDVLLVTQESLKLKNLCLEMGPKNGNFIGIYSIEEPDVGFMRGVACIYIYIYVPITVYTRKHTYMYTKISISLTLILSISIPMLCFHLYLYLC